MKLLIYSGGMDSTVMLNHFNTEIGMCVNFQYGSKHNEKELECAIVNCNRLNKKLIIINLEDTFSYFKSDLLKSGGEIPEGHYEDESMKKTVVPFRNGIMLSIATGIAESNNLDGVLIANHSGDHAIYPDCRDDFIQAMVDSISRGTDGNVKLYAPYTNKTKTEIAKIGNFIEVDFTKTYSCYNGGDVHCGVCGTCVERKEALKGFDKTTYLQ